MAKNSKNQIHRLNLYGKCLGSLNNLSIDEKDIFQYADRACESLTASDMYTCVWIALFDESSAVERIASSGSVGGGSGRKAAYDSLVKAECSGFAAEAAGVKSSKPPSVNCGDCPTVLTVRLSNNERIIGVFAAAISASPDEESGEIGFFNDIAEQISLNFYRIGREKSNQLFRYALRHMPNSFCFLSTDLRFLAVNEKYARLLGAPVDELLGRKVSDFFNAKEYDNRILPLLKRCLQGEETEDILVIESGDKAVLQLRAFYSPYIGEDGSVRGILAHGIEVSERKSSEKDLFRFFRRISDEAQYGIAIADLTGRIVYINHYFAEICGYKPRELLGKEIGVLYPERYSEEVGRLMHELGEKGHFRSKELFYLRRDGVEAPLLLSGMMLYDDFNRPIQMMAMAQDLSNLKKAEEQLKRSEVRFRKLIDTATDTICILTETGVLLEINNSACDFLGYNRDELIGKSINVIDVDYTGERFTAFWMNVGYDKQATFESRHKKRNGELFPVEVSARKILLEGDTLIISIARDITERNKVKKQMIQAVRKAEESDRMKSAFLANMSHEIRTPLNGILGFSGLMNDPDISPEQQQKYYEIIQQSGHRLLSTINDLIDISRIETGAIEMEISDVEINKLFDELHSFFYPDINSKKIDFVLKKEIYEEVHIDTDYEKLYAILSNLLRNAVKFTEKGSISLSYKLNGSNIIFEVSDTGVGIASDKLSSIFNRFVQADQSLTKPYEGFGLGLSICREYTEMLDGSIIVESYEGKGTTFTVTIPTSI